MAAKAMARKARSRSADRRDDRGIVAAELEDRAAEAAGDALGDLAAHGGRAGRRDDRHAGIVDQPLADRAPADQHASGARPARRRTAAAARLNRPSTASAVSGVFSDGFHTTASPQTKASAAFHDHTATGKLKAEMTPTTPAGCHCSIIRWSRALRGDGEAVELARQADGEVADVDHLLDLAGPFGDDLADLDGDQSAEIAPCAARSSSPRRRTSSPRCGAGTVRHASKAGRPGRSPRRPRPGSRRGHGDDLARQGRADGSITAAIGVRRRRRNPARMRATSRASEAARPGWLGIAVMAVSPRAASGEASWRRRRPRRRPNVKPSGRSDGARRGNLAVAGR